MREEYGEYRHLVQELRESDREYFFRFVNILLFIIYVIFNSIFEDVDWYNNNKSFFIHRYFRM